MNNDFLVVTKDSLKIDVKFVDLMVVRNQNGRKVKRLRIDNGLEFCNEAFDSYCATSGIARHITTTGTPQQNGFAERFNRTILERVRCMLTSVGLKMMFWAESVSITTYLINRCVTRVNLINYLIKLFLDYLSKLRDIENYWYNLLDFY